MIQLRRTEVCLNAFTFVTLFIVTPISCFTEYKEAFNFSMVHTLTSEMSEVPIQDNYDLQIFCRRADRKNPLYFFRSATLRIFSAAEDIKLFKGTDPIEIYKEFKSSSWTFCVGNVNLPWRMRGTSFPTFNSSCVGISADKPYRAKLVVNSVDPWKVSLFVGGMILFFMSAKLARSTVFFYSSATFVGTVGAVLLLIFLAIKFSPRGRGSYITMSVLYSVFFCFAGKAWTRMETLLQEALPYVIIYLFCGALISLTFCYRFGPPTHDRTHNIIQWSLQIVGLGLIHLSSDLMELSTCVIVGVVSFNYMFPDCSSWTDSIVRQARKIRYKLFPPKRKLLTTEEFMEQGEIETEKGLEELWKFCNSPKCNPWKLVSRLSNPKRFSSFMEGSSHLEDDEIMAYEGELEKEVIDDAFPADLLTDDDSDILTDDED